MYWKEMHADVCVRMQPDRKQLEPSYPVMQRDHNTF